MGDQRGRFGRYQEMFLSSIFLKNGDGNCRVQQSCNFSCDQLYQISQVMRPKGIVEARKGGKNSMTSHRAMIKILGAMPDDGSISIRDLARKLDRSERNLRRDLQTMAIWPIELVTKVRLGTHRIGWEKVRTRPVHN